MSGQANNIKRRHFLKVLGATGYGIAACSCDDQQKARQLAEADGRSLSNWVTKLIASKVEKAEKDQSGK